MNEDYVKDHLPGFGVRMIAHFHDTVHLQDELHCISIYTKHGVAWEHNYIELVIDHHDNN